MTIPLAAAVAASVLLLLAAGAKAGRSPWRPLQTVLSSARISSMSVAEVESLLEEIEEAPEAPTVYGAMCYDCAMPPLVTEYLCPACGEKTVYADSDFSRPLQELGITRELFEALEQAAGLDLALDESGFCSFCGSGGVAVPLLVITYSDGTVVRTPVCPEDLRMLIGLFSGERFYESTQDFILPLKPESGHLRSVLGLPGGVEAGSPAD
ncbi:hypothetical protein GX411_00845 [Candidatus Fermentibacteria bacterium]|nr:hypothetical protein [Candidatus Fermentibacteria bacterium]